jgi:signal transduction histidine kinase
MIRSLYLRVVLTFLSVVIVSNVLAFMLLGVMVPRSYEVQLRSDLLDSAANIARLMAANPGLDADGFFGAVSGFSLISARLYRSPQDYVVYGPEQAGLSEAITADEVEQVLRGGNYESPDNVTGPIFHHPIIVGAHVRIGGNDYALFLTPRRGPNLWGVINGVLLAILAIGSCLILVASRYIVEPLKKMTAATKELARRNFDVRLDIKHRDELGQLAQSFNRMAHELQQLEQMRQDFVSNVSHEIQTPLTSIRGFSKALQRKQIGEEERQRYLRIIEQESERLAALSENLLRLASLESNQYPFHPAPLDVDEQLRQVVVACEPLWSAKQLELELSLPKTKMIADASGLNQVWMNLLNNSIKFTPPGGTIKLSLRQHIDRIEVSIADTGIGISEEDQAHIFQRFFMVDRSREAKESGGNGLGLSIVHKIVEMHRGTIRVRSAPGKGTTFTVELPCG